MIHIEIASSDGGERLRDAAARYLLRAIGHWGVTDPDRLEQGLEGLGIAADIEMAEDGTLHAVVLPLAVVLADEREAA